MINYSNKRLEINQYRNELFDYILKHKDKDGHLYIVPNNLEKKRVGFDQYMFVTVYESYALAMLLFSRLLTPFSVNKEEY